MHMLILHSKCSINVPTSCVRPGTCRNIWNVPNLLLAGKWQVLSTRACNVLQMFLLVSRPPCPQCLRQLLGRSSLQCLKTLLDERYIPSLPTSATASLLLQRTHTRLFRWQQFGCLSSILRTLSFRRSCTRRSLTRPDLWQLPFLKTFGSIVLIIQILSLVYFPFPCTLRNLSRPAGSPKIAGRLCSLVMTF